MSKYKRYFILASVAVLLTTSSYNPPAQDLASAPYAPSSVRHSISADLSRLPLTFELNQGQTASQVRYLARGSGYSVFFTANEIVFAFTASAGQVAPASAQLNTEGDQNLSPSTHKATGTAGVLRLEFRAGNPKSEVLGEEQLQSESNYLVGSSANWHTHVPNYGRVRYKSLYSGIDALYYGNAGSLESDFVVASGADPKSIRLGVDGAERLELKDGVLIIDTAWGEVRQSIPHIYQLTGAGREDVTGGFVVTSKDEVGFKLASYDHNRPLIIDPVLDYSTYIGGSGSGYDIGTGIAVDGSGATYVTGLTSSYNFPVVGAPQLTLAGGDDAFITKIDASGLLAYSTFLGGSGSEDGPYIDSGGGIAVDDQGNAYVVGTTRSRDFPLRNPLQAQLKGASNVFVTKLNANGTEFDYSTYLGGSNEDYGLGIAVDHLGQAYVTGITNSSDFPTHLPTQPVYGGNGDAFITVINTAGSGLVYSSYLGGSGPDEARGITIDGQGDALVTGDTRSNDFPTHAALQPSRKGFADAFVTKINIRSSALIYSTYLGGRGNDFGYAVASDSQGDAYIAGSTTSSDFPIVISLVPYRASDGFVSKLNPQGSALSFSTLLGGSAGDGAFGIAVDNQGFVYVTGGTGSTDFPTQSPLQPQSAGGYDAFISKLTPSGTSLVYSTYLGGSGNEFGTSIAVDSQGEACITGITASSNFPIHNPLQPIYAGNKDAFVTKLDARGANYVYSTYLGGSGMDEGRSIMVDNQGNTYITGATGSANFPHVGQPQAAYGGGPSDAFVVKIAAGGSAIVYSTFIGGSNDDGGQSIALGRDGSAYVSGYTNSDDFPTHAAIQLRRAGGYDAFVAQLNPQGSALIYSTYLGGTQNDYAERIVVDDNSNAYLTGYTASPDFPTSSPLQPSNAGGMFDAFVTKIAAGGTAFSYSTYLGGSGSDIGKSLALGSDGSIYVAGITESTDFPTQNPFQAHNGGSSDAFVAKILPSGSGLTYSTYLGGGSYDGAEDIAVDASGNAIVTGYTWGDFPTRDPFQPNNKGAADAFVTKLDPSGSNLVYSSYLGGSGADSGQGIAVDSAGNVYVAGFTYSTDFPTQNSVQRQLAGNDDAFVTKLNPMGSTILYSTYLGGSDYDYALGIALGSDGAAYIVGATYSTDFPVVDPIQPSLKGSSNVFVAKLDGTCTINYPDVPIGYWAYSYVNNLSCLGVVGGYPDGNFHPNSNISRAELSRMLVLGYGLSLITPNQPDFTDVSRIYWAYSYIETMFAHGIISGYSDGRFQPNRQVNRAELVRMVVKASGVPSYTGASTDYSDVPSSYWAYGYIKTATHYQWVVGFPNGNFVPNAPASRGEFSKILSLSLNSLLAATSTPSQAPGAATNTPLLPSTTPMLTTTPMLSATPTTPSPTTTLTGIATGTPTITYTQTPTSTPLITPMVSSTSTLTPITSSTPTVSPTPTP